MASKLRANALQTLACSRWASAISPVPLRPHLRPYPSLPRTLQPAQFSRRYAHAIPKPSRPAPPASSSASEEIKQRKLQEPHYELTFTCVPCSERSTHTVSKQGYHKGSVLITCPSCRNRHIISDNLNIFGNRKITVEDLMKERGQLVKRGTLGEDGDVEFWEDGTVTERNKDTGTETKSSPAQSDGASASQQSSSANTAASRPLTDSPARPQLGNAQSPATNTTPSNRRKFSTFERRERNDGMYLKGKRNPNAGLKSALRNLDEQPTWESQFPSSELGHSGRNPGRGASQKSSNAPSSSKKSHWLGRGSGGLAGQSAASLRRSLKAVDEQIPPFKVTSAAPRRHANRQTPPSHSARRTSLGRSTEQLLSSTEEFWGGGFLPPETLTQKGPAGLGVPVLASEKLPKVISQREPDPPPRPRIKLRKQKARRRIPVAERDLYGDPEARIIRQSEIGVIEAAERKARAREERGQEPKRARFTLRKYSSTFDIPGYIARTLPKKESGSSDQGPETEVANPPIPDGKITPILVEGVTGAVASVYIEPEAAPTTPLEGETKAASSPGHVEPKYADHIPSKKLRRRETTSFVYAWPSGGSEPVRIGVTRPRKNQSQ